MQRIQKIIVQSKSVILLVGFLNMIMLSVATDATSPLVFDIGVTRYRESGEFYRGEPICVRVGMRRQNYTEATGKNLVQIGTKDNPWYKNITFTVHRIQETEVQPVSGSGVEGGREKVVADDKNKLLLNDVRLEQLGNQSEKHELRTNEITRSFWAISPDVTSNLSAGKYTIQAIFDTTDIAKTHPEILCTNILSSEVTIVLNEPPSNNTTQVEIMEARARYLELQGKHDDVIALLEQVERLSPSRQEIHCRLGRAYELQGDIKNAIREYRIYVEWAKKQPATGKGGPRDHADAIESTIKALEARLSKEK